MTYFTLYWTISKKSYKLFDRTQVYFESGLMEKAPPGYQIRNQWKWRQNWWLVHLAKLGVSTLSKSTTDGAVADLHANHFVNRGSNVINFTSGLLQISLSSDVGWHTSNLLCQVGSHRMCKQNYIWTPSISSMLAESQLIVPTNHDESYIQA